MEIEIFYNAGGADILPLEYMRSATTARILARQMSNCDLIYATRLRHGGGTTEDFQNGVSEHERT